ncbi:MAG: recombinase family protein [Verrucomicrobiota bacterium]
MTAPNEKQNTANANPKICFSYIRFSSGQQAKGNSTDRQLDIAPQVARDKGWELNNNLSIADLGLSAFKKANLGPKGKLGAVLTGVQSGKIPKGSVMIVEALDRLTRIFVALSSAEISIPIWMTSNLYLRGQSAG